MGGPHNAKISSCTAKRFTKKSLFHMRSFSGSCCSHEKLIDILVDLLNAKQSRSYHDLVDSERVATYSIRKKERRTCVGSYSRSISRKNGHQVRAYYGSLQTVTACSIEKKLFTGRHDLRVCATSETFTRTRPL